MLPSTSDMMGSPDEPEPEPNEQSEPPQNARPGIDSGYATASTSSPSAQSPRNSIMAEKTDESEFQELPLVPRTTSKTFEMVKKPKTRRNGFHDHEAVAADSRSGAESDAGQSDASSGTLSIATSLATGPKPFKPKGNHNLHLLVQGQHKQDGDPADPQNPARKNSMHHPSIHSIHSNSVEEHRTKTYRSIFARLSTRNDDTNFNPTNVFSIRQLKKSYSQHKAKKREALRHKIPLTERNIETFVDEQDLNDACDPLRGNREVSISKWLQLIPSVSIDHSTVKHTTPNHISQD